MEKWMEIDLSLAENSIQRILNGAVELAPNMILAIMVVLVFYVIARIVKSSVVQVIKRAGRTRYTGDIIGRLSQWAIVLVGFLAGFSVLFPSLSAADLVGLLGIGGIAIGFAFRDIAQNFLAGILLLLTQPFRLGDQIIVNEYEGTVVDIQTRATVIKTYDGRHVVIPNSDLFTDSVIVNTADSTRRSEYDVGIAYSDDINFAKRLIVEAMQGVDAVLEHPAPDALTVELNDSSVDIRARWWTDSSRREVVMVRDQVITAIKYSLDRNGVTIPFPIRTVHVPDDSPIAGRSYPSRRA
jgi:small conductance mechanosensitive channel